MWVIIIQPQIFKDKYLQCVFTLIFFPSVSVLVGSRFNLELYGEATF